MKLDVYYTNIDVSTLVQLESIPTLKILICGSYLGSDEDEDEKIKNLVSKLPHIRINPNEYNNTYLNIATSRDSNR